MHVCVKVSLEISLILCVYTDIQRLTLSGDSPPMYTNSTLCLFKTCSNICLLGSDRTEGLCTQTNKMLVFHLSPITESDLDKENNSRLQMSTYCFQRVLTCAHFVTVNLCSLYLQSSTDRYWTLEKA